MNRNQNPLIKSNAPEDAKVNKHITSDAIHLELRQTHLTYRTDSVFMVRMSNAAINILKDEKARLVSELDAHKEAVRDLNRKVKEIDAAIFHLIGDGDVPVTESARQPRGSGPRLANLVAQALPRDGAGTTALEISKQLTDAGRETTNTTVSSILSRMRKDGTAVKKNGFWYLATDEKGPDETSEPFSSSGDGDGSQGRASHPSPAGSTPVVSTVLHREREKFLGQSSLSSAQPTIKLPGLGNTKGG
ncbi:hypothetical protein [Roseibium litorale]|uniref:Uncharacterized protein n=1 Tax=Roseibium litorale TaxID=2803841 RepID=A0ABR9CMK9_9HYPH|nr:hypothetical protein [Roseibium litorale]MBD8892096.1 hypothetical protein [Roseibium litorale]